MAEQGKRDVTKDLQDRTDPIPADKLLMVNGATKQVQQIELEKLGDVVGGSSPESLWDLLEA